MMCTNRTETKLEWTKAFKQGTSKRCHVPLIIQPGLLTFATDTLSYGVRPDAAA